MLVKEIFRNSVIAWSPTVESPHLIATGTMSGSMSSDFDPSGTLEIFSTDSFGSLDKNMIELGGSRVPEKFNVIGWENPNPAEFKYGIIVGGFPSGTLRIWDPAPVITKQAKSPTLLFEKKSHSSNLYSLDFNPHQPTLLSTGGPNSEVFIWNLASPSNPTIYTPGEPPGSQANSDIVSTAWNSKHKHILATCARNGCIAIWDLRKKSTIFSFSDPSKLARYKSIKWHPDQPMKIVAASENDDHPAIHLWDLKSTLEPSKILRGHSRGIVCMDWNPEDSSLLVTSGKDNRIICWDMDAGETISDIGAGSSNFNFDLKWSPVLRTSLAAASLDGSVRVFSVQDFSTKVIDDQDSFNIGGQDMQHATVPKRAPGWLMPRAGARFSFGGRLTSFTKDSRNVTVSNVITEPSLVQEAQKLENAMSYGNYLEFCEAKIQALDHLKEAQPNANVDDEKLIWAFIRSTLDEGKSRKALLAHIGHDVEVMNQTIRDYLKKLPECPEMDDLDNEVPVVPNDVSNQRIDDEDDFAQLQKRAQMLEEKQKSEKLSFDLSNQTPDESILMKCIITGNFEDAIECCIRNGKIADALAIASSAGPELWEKTLKIYFRLNREKPFVSVLNAISSKDFKTFVQKVDLRFWREALALLCTYADQEHFQNLCLILGDRLIHEANNTQKGVLLYVCSGSIEKVAPYWAKEFVESPEVSGLKLHELIEKIVIFSKAMSIDDNDIAEYVGKYYQSYSELLSSQGSLSLAYYFLSNVNDTSFSYQVLLDRLYNSIGPNVQGNRPSFPYTVEDYFGGQQSQSRYNQYNQHSQQSQPQQNQHTQQQQRMPTQGTSSKRRTRQPTHSSTYNPSQRTVQSPQNTQQRVHGQPTSHIPQATYNTFSPTQNVQEQPRRQEPAPVSMKRPSKTFSPSIIPQLKDQPQQFNSSPVSPAHVSRISQPMSYTPPVPGSHSTNSPQTYRSNQAPPQGSRLAYQPPTTNQPQTYQPPTTSQPQTYQPPTTSQPQTYQPPTANKPYQPPTNRPPTSNPPQTYQPPTLNKLPSSQVPSGQPKTYQPPTQTFQSPSSRQPTIQPQTYQPPTSLPPTSNQPQTSQPPTTSQPQIYQPPTTSQPQTYQPPTTNMSYQPSMNQPPTGQPQTHQPPTSFQPQSPSTGFSPMSQPTGFQPQQGSPQIFNPGTGGSPAPPSNMPPPKGKGRRGPGGSQRKSRVPIPNL